VEYSPLRERNRNGGAPEYGPAVRFPAHVEPMAQRIQGAESEEAILGVKVIVDSEGMAIGEQGRLVVNGISRQIQQSVPVYDTDGSLSHYEVFA
jgi:hypothetical protein